MAVKRRVGLRIDPYQKARAMEKGRKQEAENGLGAVWARRMSAKSATGAPVTASGCKQQSCRSIEAVPARVWKTKVVPRKYVMLPSLSERWLKVKDGSFFHASVKGP